MTFAQLMPDDHVHILEITGTFKKNTVYSLGTVMSVSSPYDEPLQPGQFPINQTRRKLVDITVTCDGEQKKLSVADNKSITTDASIGLTISTDKDEIVSMVKQSYNSYKLKKESASKYDDEMRRCEDILKILNYSEPTSNVPNDFQQVTELKSEVKELKEMLSDLLRSQQHKETVPQEQTNQVG